MEPGWERVENTSKLREMMTEIFSDEFMQKYTKFQNFEGFRYSSAVIIDWEGEELVYPILLLDNFVKESTDFMSWEEMVRTAVDLRFPRRQA